MTLEIVDHQDPSSEVNGITVKTQDALAKVFISGQAREPFFCELLGSNGYKLLVGMGRDIGCVQHSSNDGNPPYLMAVLDGPQEEEYEFLTADTPTPVRARYCLPIDKVMEIAAYFLLTGKRDLSIRWEEI